MTYFPKYLTTYPNMDGPLPCHVSLNRVTKGYPSHRHDFLEFSYVIEGSGAESVNGIIHPMKPGTFTFVLPYQVHELFTDPGSTLVLYNCMFSLSLLMESPAGRDSWFGLLLEDAQGLPPFLQLEGNQRETMRRLTGELFEEYVAQEWGRTALLKAKLTETLVRFDRLRRREQQETRTQQASGRAERTIWPLIQYIHAHYHHERLTLSELSGRFQLSASRISEMIKETTGQTFVHFLTDLRLKYAIGLLASTDMSMMEIAAESGFGSYKTFVKMFRERQGIPPTAYRKSRSAPR